jgi:hypothetical protein
MRLMMTIGLVVLSLAAVGCDGSEAPAPGNALATPGSADAGAGGTAAVATAGRADAAAAAPATPAPAAPVWREVTIPAGTSLPIVLDTSVGSETSRVEQAVTAHLSRAITIGGETVLPEGSRVSGVVTDATQSAKVKGRAHVAMRFTSLTPRGGDEPYEIATATVGRTAPATKKEDALKIGAPAAGGAIIGAIVGGKKGAAIGAAAGGGGGTAVVLSTRGKEVTLPRGAALTLKLAEPLTVRIKG